MKSIGVFGDSYTGQADGPSAKYHWSTLLAKHYDCEMKNYGTGGSSIYFSYKQFLENHHKHDLNIFLITETSRYIKPVTLYSGKEIYIPSISVLDQNKDDIYSHKQEDLRGWFMVSDETYNNDMAYLMLEKIYTISGNTIFISCFGNWLSTQIKEYILEKDAIDFWNLYAYQAKLFGFDPFELVNKYTENNLVISGHLVPEIHELVSEKIINRISTGVWENTMPSNIKFKYAFSEAFIKN